MRCTLWYTWHIIDTFKGIRSFIFKLSNAVSLLANAEDFRSWTSGWTVAGTLMDNAGLSDSYGFLLILNSDCTVLSLAWEDFNVLRFGINLCMYDNKAKWHKSGLCVWWWLYQKHYFNSSHFRISDDSRELADLPMISVLDCTVVNIT